jgi:hypothetical protein
MQVMRMGLGRKFSTPLPLRKKGCKILHETKEQKMNNVAANVLLCVFVFRPIPIFFKLPSSARSSLWQRSG